MGTAAASQPLGGAFEHDPLRRRNLAQHLDVGAGHDPGVQMRQQPGFAQHQPGHLGEVGEGGLVAEPVERLARRGVAQFRLVAQGEQSLMAAGLGSGAGDRQHLLGAQINRLAEAGRMGKGAVMAHVAAQLGQRDENLGRIGYEPAMSARRAGPRRASSTAADLHLRYRRAPGPRQRKDAAPFGPLPKRRRSSFAKLSYRRSPARSNGGSIAFSARNARVRGRGWLKRKGGEILGVVNVEGDPRQTQHGRPYALRFGGPQMREKAVDAKTQRHRVGRRA